MKKCYVQHILTLQEAISKIKSSVIKQEPIGDILSIVNPRDRMRVDQDLESFQANLKLYDGFINWT